MADAVQMSAKHWIPVESNPEVFAAYAESIGLPADVAFYDVLSDEDWALEMVPRPVYALFLLFPIKESIQAATRVHAPEISPPAQLYHCIQNIDNACGTLALLHAVANNSSLLGGPIELPEGSWADRFIKSTVDMSPAARAAALEADRELDDAQADAAQQGQSDVIDDTNLHFIAFVTLGGQLWELDGRNATPVTRGPSSQETLLHDAAKVIRSIYMNADPDEVRFNMMAMTQRGDDMEEDA